MPGKVSSRRVLKAWGKFEFRESWKSRHLSSGVGINCNFRAGREGKKELKSEFDRFRDR